MPRRIKNENVQSILDVPASVLPSGAARDYLLEAADAGQDIYAYSPTQLEQRPELRRYNVWLAGQRYDLQAWLAHFYDERNNQGV